MKKRKSSVRQNNRSLSQIIIFFIFSIFLASCFSSLVTYKVFFGQNKIIKNIYASSSQDTPSYIEQNNPFAYQAIINGNDNTVKLNKAVIFHGSRDKKQIALTFDAEMTDGMRAYFLSGHSSFDKRIVDILNQTDTKATLFLTGMWISLYPEVTKELASNPLFELANHSYADDSYSGFCYGLKQISDTQDLEDIETTQRLLRDATSSENHYFRFPGGCYSLKDLDVVMNKAGLQVVHWDVAGSDGFNYNTVQIEQNIINNIQNGSIIILHMNGAPTAPKTAEALPKIISTLKEKGYEFVKVSELLGSE